ncbi:phosphatidate cytidylyltransferase [Kinneretia asaccharophila]|uniref:Phosphatidate cytidylyltransferase n=1 Tax=Roseateles asaccharophilus TaxID=582607 RepID=A0A4R6NAT5_9BURK|nr:phosphatidate cytidylyltransferase [Roseateles asaccharophilus]MDN3543878.1 phosphatidate cytidylyltransferase [Roseateles asaccharophilus]TDP11744.1 phosphatidate cytidylyltransferase [Roseateles asaccharophilus]
MLKQRILTALVLLAVLLPALFAASAWPFAVLTIVMIGAAAWEWARLNAVPGRSAWLFGGALSLLCLGTLLLLGRDGQLWPASPLAWWLAGGLWVLGGGYALSQGPQGWPRLPRLPRLLLGGLALWAAWLAMVQARALGLNFLLSIFCLVWAADVFAYFGGKAMGRRKLAPAISPGKSWEGVWTGMAGVLIMALVWAYVVDARFSVDSLSVYSLLLRKLGWWVGGLGLLLLVAMSVVGDLFESLIKRATGAKDSSQLLPGHGGVLDRIDALLPVFPLALALSSLVAKQ